MDHYRCAGVGAGGKWSDGCMLEVGVSADVGGDNEVELDNWNDQSFDCFPGLSLLIVRVVCLGLVSAAHPIDDEPYCRMVADLSDVGCLKVAGG